MSYNVLIDEEGNGYGIGYMQNINHIYITGISGDSYYYNSSKTKLSNAPKINIPELSQQKIIEFLYSKVINCTFFLREDGSVYALKNNKSCIINSNTNAITFDGNYYNGLQSNFENTIYTILTIDKEYNVYYLDISDTDITSINGMNKIDTKYNIASVSIGYKYILMIDVIGRLYYCTGELDKLKFQRVYHPHMVTKIDTNVYNNHKSSFRDSDFHSIILDELGDIYTFGVNYYNEEKTGTNVLHGGQLGLGNIYNTLIIPDPEKMKIPPIEINNKKKIDMGNPIVSISAGNNCSLVLDNCGNVYGFGSNNNGRLGLNNEYNPRIETPTKLDISNIVTIYASKEDDDVGFLIDTNGDVYGFGNGINGEFGQNHSDVLKQPTKITYENLVDNKIVNINNTNKNDIQFETPKNAIHILENNIGQLRLLRSTYIELYNSNFKDIFNKLPKSNVLRIYANDNAFCYIRKDNRNTEYEYLYAFGDNYSGGTLPYTIKSNQSDQFSYLFVEKNFQSSYKIVHTKYAFALLNKYNNKLYLWGHPLFGGNYQGLNIVENCSNVFANDYAFLVVRDNNPTSPVFTTGHPLYGGDMFQLQSLFSNANENVQYTIQNVYHTKTSFTLRLLDTNDKNHYITLGIHNTDIIE